MWYEAARTACRALAAGLLAVALVGCDSDALFGEGPGGDDDFEIPSAPGESDDPTDPGGGADGVVLFGVGPAGLLTIDESTATVASVGPLAPGTPNRFTQPTGMAIRRTFGGEEIFVWNDANGDIITGTLLTVDRCTGEASAVEPLTAPQGEVTALAAQGTNLFAVGPSLEGLTEPGRMALLEVDPDTGELFQIGMGLTSAPTSLEVRPSDGALFAAGPLFPAELPVRLVSINANSGLDIIVGPLDSTITRADAIAFSTDGRLVGVGVNIVGESVLFEISPSNGRVSNSRALTDVVDVFGLGFATSCDADALSGGESGDDLLPGGTPSLPTGGSFGF